MPGNIGDQVNISSYFTSHFLLGLSSSVIVRIRYNNNKDMQKSFEEKKTIFKNEAYDRMNGFYSRGKTCQQF